MIPAATAFLLPFFWIVSVIIERPVFHKIAGCDQGLAKSWSWKANMLTYGLAIVAVLVWLVVNVGGRS